MDPINVLWLITIPIVSLFAHLIYTESYSVPKHFFLSVAALTTFLILYLRALRKKEPIVINFTVFHILFGLFWISSTASIINIARDNPYLLRYSLDVNLYLLIFVFLSWFFSNYMNTREKIEKIFLVFLIVSVVVAANGVLNYYTGYDVFVGLSPDITYRGRIRSTIGNVIFVANFLNMLTPLALYFYLKSGTSKLTKILSFVFITLSFYILLVGQVRSEYISWVVQILLGLSFITLEFFSDSRSTRKKVSDFLRCGVWQFIILVMVLLVVAILLLAFPNPLNHYKRIGEIIFSPIESRITGEVVQEDFIRRKVAWLAAVEIWKRHKVLGQGIGSYRYYGGSAVAKVCNENPKYRFAWQPFDTVHNDYLQVLAEVGLVGFGIVLALFVWLLTYVFQNYSKLSEDKKTLFLVLTLSFTPFAVQMFFCYPVQILPNSLLALILVSTGIGEYFNIQKNTKLRVKISARIVFLIGFIFATLLVVGVFLRASKFLSDVYSRQGKVALYSLSSLIETEEPKNGELLKNNSTVSNTALQSYQEEIKNNITTAVLSLYKSIKINPSNGIAYYLLSNMLGYDKTLSMIHTNMKEFFDKLFKEFCEASAKEFINSLAHTLKTEELLELKSLYVSLSLLDISEKVSLYPLVQLAKTDRISRIMNRLSNMALKSDLSDKLRVALSNEIEKKFVELEKTALKTIYEFSGGWITYMHAKNPDIETATRNKEDIHREVIHCVLNSGELDSKRLSLVKRISDFEREVCLDLERNGYWGIPDAGLTFFTTFAKQLAEKDKDRAREILKSTLRDYKEIYNLVVQKLEKDSRFVEEFETVKKNIATLLKAVLSRESANLNEIVQDSFNKAYRKALENFINYDFSRYVEIYISELRESEFGIRKTIYATSPWKYFATPVIFAVMNNLQNIQDVGMISRIFGIVRLLVDPSFATSMFLYERYQIFKHMYEYAQKIYQLLGQDLLH
ncbi:O-antigen ligase family protein [Fervidobacterium thailandense]|uniref:O-antigen ligase-related domain-containing protein n=1 Tax=Fervidobacterium thailandense TaxID=1008305 RepID=A0A1E3G3H5_9BACT|nr:O-antigen ligase family protein [Fervidobacterium thailandense]ODN30826.1 hypothetical protein A4H02_02860 [Fervidobacterium thailandense]